MTPVENYTLGSVTLLLGVRDKTHKIELIKEAVEEEYSVRALREKIAEIKPKRARKHRPSEAVELLGRVQEGLKNANANLAEIVKIHNGREEYIQLQDTLSALIATISGYVNKEKKLGRDQF